MSTKLLMALGAASLLIGCASTTSHLPQAPSIPYWQNPQWISELAAQINSNLIYPVAATTVGFPSGQAIVQFTYDDGKLENTKIIKSTGSQILDSAIIAQIADIKPPLARGLETNLPRQFQLPVSLNIGDSQFYRSLDEAVRAATRTYGYYPRSAVLNGNQGRVTVRFQYRNGTVLNPTVVNVIGSKIFERAALKALSYAKMPPAPAWARDKTLDLKVDICFIFTGTHICPGPNIEILYTGSNAPPAATTNACTEVGFDYKGRKISNVYVVNSSGNPNLDKVALLTISQGNFTQPSTALKNQTSSFEIPVCFSDKAPGRNSAKTPL